MDLQNRIAVVTGAASGIGMEIAKDLAQHGCTLVVVDVQKDKLNGALDEVLNYSPASTAELCDISDDLQAKQVVQTVCERYGRIDILINNAGIMIVKSFSELSEEEFRRHIDVNFYGAVSMTQAVIPVMKKQGKGVIMNVASVGGKLVVPGTTAYAASKAAIYAFSEALYYELKDEGIHVGVVVPGGIRTGIFDVSDSRLGTYYRDQCKTSPSKITKKIRKAIEKERFETVVPFNGRILLAVRGTIPSLFMNMLLRRLRPYME